MTIIARVAGGLGNQMFQYAAAYALAKSRHARLAVDTSCCGGVRPSYALGHFRASGEVITTGPISRLCHRLAGSSRFRGLAATARMMLGLTDVAETREFCFRPITGPDARRIRLLGYWQSYRYFDEFAEDIRREFSPQAGPVGRNAELLKQIQVSPGAVSVHIRRGDYLNVRPQAVLPVEYYQQAAKIIASAGASPVFYLFSDDMASARRALQLGGEVIPVVGNESAGHEDLRLMSACRHHIIANSSFSWWGAWLNPKADKLVVAPRHWLGGAESHCEDLFPEGWRCI